MDQPTFPETRDENNISIVTNDTDTSLPSPTNDTDTSSPSPTNDTDTSSQSPTNDTDTSSDKDDQLKDQTVEDMDDEELKGMVEEDEFETEGMDKDEKEFWGRFLLEPFAEPHARSLAEPFCIKAAEVIEKNGFFMDPTNDSHMGKKKVYHITQNCGIYVIFDDDGKMVKIGSTSDFKTRRSYYQATGTSPKKFVVVVDFDNTNQAVNDEMEKLYREMMETLMNDDLLPCALLRTHFFFIFL